MWGAVRLVVTTPKSRDVATFLHQLQTLSVRIPRKAWTVSLALRAQGENCWCILIENIGNGFGVFDLASMIRVQKSKLNQQYTVIEYFRKSSVSREPHLNP